MTTPADIAKLTATQQDVLGQIACGFDASHHPRVIKALLAKGLIEATERRIYGSGNTAMDRIPVIMTGYNVPLPVHIAWAEWASEQPEEEDEDEGEP